MRDKLVKDDKVAVCIGGDNHTTVLEWTPHQERESCFSCVQIFEEDDFILAAYGLLFCTTDCVLDTFPDADLNDVEIILASDIGVE